MQLDANDGSRHAGRRAQRGGWREDAADVSHTTQSPAHARRVFTSAWPGFAGPSA